MRPSSRSRWLVIIGLLTGMPVVFVLTYVLVVPFTESKIYIDRRTSEEHVIISRYGFTSEINPTTNRFALSKYGDLTAPETRLVKYTYVKRFPWGAHEAKEVSPGSRIDVLAKTMFSFRYPFPPRLSPIPQELVDKLMTERIAVWNTDRIEKETESLIEYYMDENLRLLPPLKKHPYGRD